MKDDWDDDEEDFDLRTTGGKIIPSGITSDTVGPADYALPPGTPALQQPDTHEIPSDEQASRSFGSTNARVESRQILVAIAMGALMLGCGIAVGWLLRTQVGPDGSRRLTAIPSVAELRNDVVVWAEQLAKNSTRELQRHDVAFLAVADHQDELSPALWDGILRLALASLADRGESRVARVRRVLLTIEKRMGRCPESILQLVGQLRAALPARDRGR